MRLTTRLTALMALSSLAPSMSRNAGRGPLNHRPVRNAEGGGDGGAAGGTGKTPTTPAGGGAKDPPDGGGDGARAFSQADLDRIVTREKGKAAKEAEALRAKLAEYEARDAESAEKAKAAADTSGETAKTKRDLERAAKERDEAKALADTRLQRYHATLVDAAVSRALVGLDFIGADAAEVVESKVRSFAKVESEGDGEAVYLVDGKDEIAMTDREKVASWMRKKFPSLLKAASGAGGPHGAGRGTSTDTKNLTPGQKIAAEMASRG
jgi:hypothetical protein